MSVQTVNNIAGLKLVTGATHEVAEVLGYYAINDGGGGEFYWDAGSTATDNGGTIIQATGVPTGRWLRIVDDKINAKWFGATGDGSTDDSVAVNKALTMIANDLTRHVYFPTGIYRVESAAQTTITGKSDFVIEMDDDATFINDDFTDYLTASATFSGNTATITTTVSHGYSSGSLIAVKDFPDLAYNGAVVITVTGATTFTYTLVRTPAGSSSGKVRGADISKTLITLDNCSNVNIGFRFSGTVQMSAVQSRLGWVGLKLQNDCSFISARIHGSGISYGVWSGNFEADEGNLTFSDITVQGADIGYPVALWKSGDECVINVTAESVHRGVYAAAVKNSTFNLLLKNYDITGILLTSHYVGTTTYGCENLTINVKDFGSDITVPTPRASYTVGIGGYYLDYETEIKNVDINIQTSNAKCVTPLYIRTLSHLHKVSNINIRGLIDRRNLSDSEIVNEFVIGGEDEVGKAGIYSGINFLSWRVYNPTGGTTKPLSLKFVTLLDDINFVDFLSSSPRSITLPAGRRIMFPTQKIEGTEGDPNGFYTAKKGDLYVNTSIHNLDRTIYLKTNASGNLGWFGIQTISFGPTSSRPSLSGLTRGFMYYDTTLGRPVWWNGSTWNDLISEPLINATSNTTLALSDTNICVDATSGNKTITLPDATTSRGKRFVIKKVDSSANTVTVATVSSQKIDQCDGIILNAQNSILEIISNGTSWIILNYYNPIIADGTSTITKSVLNTSYLFSSYPVGTTIFYYEQDLIFVRTAPTEWRVSSSSVLS
jgi:hypothetical protein